MKLFQARRKSSGERAEALDDEPTVAPIQTFLAAVVSATPKRPPELA